jgi:hypothetical protein
MTSPRSTERRDTDPEHDSYTAATGDNLNAVHGNTRCPIRRTRRLLWDPAPSGAQVPAQHVILTDAGGAQCSVPDTDGPLRSWLRPKPVEARTPRAASSAPASGNGWLRGMATLLSSGARQGGAVAGARWQRDCRQRTMGGGPGRNMATQRQTAQCCYRRCSSRAPRGCVAALV